MICGIDDGMSSLPEAGVKSRVLDVVSDPIFFQTVHHHRLLLVVHLSFQIRAPKNEISNQLLTLFAEPGKKMRGKKKTTLCGAQNKTKSYKAFFGCRKGGFYVKNKVERKSN